MRNPIKSIIIYPVRRKAFFYIVRGHQSCCFRVSNWHQFFHWETSLRFSKEFAPVEELIGVTSDKKNGLEDFRGRRVFFTGSDKFDTIKLHHSNSGIYRHISFSLRLSQEGYINSLLIFSGTTGNNKYNIRCDKAVW